MRLSAVTLVSADMAASCAFYDALGFSLRYGGPDATFTSFHVGDGYLNIQLDPSWQAGETVWGRVIVWVDDVDATYARATAAGLHPLAAPADAPWGERYFHIRDPDGHELSFARLLESEGR